MKSYEVRVSKLAEQRLFATLEVEAETDEEAKAKALQFAEANGEEVVWEVPIDAGIERQTHPEIVSVEVIVDLAETS